MDKVGYNKNEIDVLIGKVEVIEDRTLKIDRLVTDVTAIKTRCGIIHGEETKKNHFNRE